MWTFHPEHRIVNSGFLFHRTPFDREYPHPLNDFFWRVCAKTPGCTVATVDAANVCRLYDISPAVLTLQSSSDVLSYTRDCDSTWARPVDYTGPNPVLYLSFDDSKCITQHGTSITTGRVGNGLVASADQSWASVGKFPDQCFTQPEKCANGITVSFWLRVDDSTIIGNAGGLLSTRSGDGGNNAAFAIYITSTARLIYQILHDTNQGCNLNTIAVPTAGWIHSVFTWKQGSPLIVYHDAVQVIVKDIL